MDFIRKFNKKHYDYYIHKIDTYIDGSKDVDKWIKKISDNELIVWVRTIKYVELNNRDYYMEMSMLLTIIIKFFIIELDINEMGVNLKNTDIEKLFKNFKHILYTEYSNRNNIGKFKIENYSLIK